MGTPRTLQAHTPHPGLPLCWQELQAGLAEEGKGEEWLPKGAEQRLPHQPPGTHARGTSPPEELLPRAERWDPERELELRTLHPPCPPAKLPLSPLGEDLGAAEPHSKQPSRAGHKGACVQTAPSTRRHHITRLSTLPTTGGCWGGDDGPFSQLKDFSWGTHWAGL